ncbi:sensor histidine kinase [Candidatus Phycosocius spiralis]|uniref:histidine kinase n=2 Tax=Candidatus Phycosocius spiralis TaxID=2815099 RepID=A0ABQ4PVY7_9PROT|nr:sensor histidine kinase [Candidatus Phycosocius spiralis]
MGLGIAIKKPKHNATESFGKTQRRHRRGGIAGIIFIANFAGILILVLGSLLFNELRSGLTKARMEALRAQGSTIASVIAEAAIPPDALPALDEMRARAILRQLTREPGARLRLFDRELRPIADSSVLDDTVEVRQLPPLGPAAPDVVDVADRAVANARVFIQGASDDPHKALIREISTALQGQVVQSERFDENGRRVVSVTVPIQRIRAVVGVLTLESSDVSEIVDAERRALYPFILSAILVTALSATLLAWSIAVPLRRLAAAADDVRRGRAQALGADKLRQRPDEIGDLADALAAMTQTLQDRINANESFAADVAHEIKNPLAAIRNAAELLPRATSEESKAKLESIILSDARRVDRLVTDIANASRLDAELARASQKKFAMADMIDDMGRVYASIAHAHQVKIIVQHTDETDRLLVSAREEAISRVLTNLLDNALSFSPAQANIYLRGTREHEKVCVQVEDEGPGIPQEALQSVFKRFYTHRPTSVGEEGQAAFGKHSGLGLAIARQIAESHGGILWVENRTEGQGARFVLELPAA